MKKFNLDIVISKLKAWVVSDNPQSVIPVKHGVFLVIAIGLTAAMVQFQKEPLPESPPSPESLDTYIPEGQSLVPIQVSNYESLDQVIGQYGVVDLLSTPLSPAEKSRRVAYAVKLIRSPKSPRHFSVLIPADKAYKLAGYHGEFTVVVRNPKLVGTKIVNKGRRKPTRPILYETESL